MAAHHRCVRCGKLWGAHPPPFEDVPLCDVHFAEENIAALEDHVNVESPWRFMSGEMPATLVGFTAVDGPPDVLLRFEHGAGRFERRLAEVITCD